MKNSISAKTVSLTFALSLLTTMGFAATVNAQAAKTAKTAPSAAVKAIITSGDQNIANRLTALKALSTKITALQKVTPADKASLLNNVTSTTTGLTKLKATLDGETKLAAAQADKTQIITGYRVFYLVIPRVHVIKVADDQQVREIALNKYATMLQTRVNNSPQKATLAPKVDDMLAKVKATSQISLTAETNVMTLKPSDYNSNHQIVANFFTALKTAQAENVVAHTEGDAVAAALKNDKAKTPTNASLQ